MGKKAYNHVFSVRDSRTRSHFIIDDLFYDVYLQHCGVYALAAYTAICRHSNSKTQEAYPSLESMAQRANISRASIIRGVDKLVEYNIIQKTKDRSKVNGKWLHNTYILMDKSVWKPIHVATSNLVEMPNYVAVSNPNYVADSNTKDSHKKGYARSERAMGGIEVNEIIESFKQVNPAYGKMFGNMTQRKATDELLALHGKVRLLEVIAVLPKTNLMPYVPVVTSPWELREKWSRLESALLRKKHEIKSKGRGLEV